MDFPQFINLPLETLASIGFLLVVGIYAVFSFIMYYHWREYSVEPTVTKITLLLYFIITIPLICLLGFVTLII
jgi:hypothetical protein